MSSHVAVEPTAPSPSPAHAAHRAASEQGEAAVEISSGPKLGPANDDASDVSQKAGPQSHIRWTVQPCEQRTRSSSRRFEPLLRHIA